MTTTEDDDNTGCQTCQSNGIRLTTHGEEKVGSESYLQAGDASHFLHETCSQCDNMELDPCLRLCDTCRHLRIWHLLTCRGQTEWYGDLEHCNQNTKQCDFCHFVISAAEESGRAHGEILDFQDVDSVKFDFYNRYHRDGLLRCNHHGFLVGVHGKEEHFAGDHEVIVYPMERPITRAFFNADFLSFSESEKDTKTSMSRLHSYIQWDQYRTWSGSEALLSPSKKSRGNPLLQQPLQDVRVVDVIDGCIVPLPRDARFVALSYVWGSDCAKDFRTLRSNVASLEIPNSLNCVGLPLTILDAITVCRRLEYRYLWVDRLCIIQDELHAEAIQLKQMANLYHQAALTIVAAAGSSAAHGLMGVSRAREEQQQLKLHSSLKLVQSVPELKQVLAKSTWSSRAWTFQEFLASTRMMYFTQHGLYVGHRSGPSSLSVYTEASAVHQPTYDRMQNSFEALESYTAKSLTHPSDRLRGFSGILFATHGNKTVYGLSTDDFDRDILWRRVGPKIAARTQEQKDTMPTWSWASVGGPIKFYQKYYHNYSLAYWGRFVPGNDNVVKVVIGPPNATYQGERDGSDHAVAALAWLAGCLRSEPPAYLKIDCSNSEYEERLYARWTGNAVPGYWKDAFREYSAEKLFESVADDCVDATRRIMVHTQKASFTLDRRSRIRGCKPRPRKKPDNIAILVRSRGMVAGAIELDDDSIDSIGSRNMDQCEIDLIALSVGPEDHDLPPVMPCFDSPPDGTSISEFFGCPCSSQHAIEIEPKAHLVECPKHIEFGTSSLRWKIPFSSFGGDPEQEQTDRARAFVKHWEGLSYLGIDGTPLDKLQYMPELYVMAVAPSPGQEEGGVVYQRLGIGRMYLKRWVDASPKFETIVLE
jgi:hypothetical protein